MTELNMPKKLNITNITEFNMTEFKIIEFNISETVTNDKFMISAVVPANPVHQSFFASSQSKENMTMDVFKYPETAQKTNDHIMIVIIAIFTAAILLFSIW